MLDLAMPNAGNTKYKLDPIFKGTITCRTSIHIAPLKNIFQKEETGW